MTLVNIKINWLTTVSFTDVNLAVRVNRPHLRHLPQDCPRSCLRHCPKRQQDGVSDTHRHNNIYPYGIFIRYMYKIAVSFFCSFRSPPFVCNFTNHSRGDSPPPPPPPCPSLSLTLTQLTLISLSSFAHLWESGGDNALSYHGNRALMWSWPDVAIAITL